MSHTPIQPQASDDLQFTTAEAANPSSTAESQNCATCGQPITATYFAIGEAILCPTCTAHASAPPTGSKPGRLVKATLLGLGAGLVGALIWFAIRRVTNLEIGLVAILVGFMVGKGVRAGSGNQGGRGYQVLAVVITYACIAANYMPDIFEAMFSAAREQRAAAAVAPHDDGKEQPEAAPAEAHVEGAAARDAAQPADAPRPPIGAGELLIAVASLLLFAFIFALQMPFLAGMENVIGLLIIGFALWEAWKFNAWRPAPISGPYQIAPSPGA